MGKIDRKKKIRLVINIVLVVIFISLFSYITLRYAPSITRLVSKPQRFRHMLLSYGYKSAFVFMFFQMLQVVIAVIPGEFIQIAGGYVYGTLGGTLYSTTGILIGSFIVFYIVRLIGYPLVKTFIPKKSIEKFEFLMNNPKSEIAMFILFLIPGVPKDILTYIAGLTPVKPHKFFLIAMVGRFPALLVSAYIGSNIQHSNYTKVIIISVVAVLFFIAGILFKDKVINKISSIIHKKSDVN